MKVSLDFETRLVSQAEPAPKPICLAVCWGDSFERDLIHAKDPACQSLFREVLEEAVAGRVRITGFNSAFDMVVASEWFGLLELVFAAYEADAIHCTMIRQKLIDIARGEYRGYRNGLTGKWVQYEYNLAFVASRYGVPELDKDTWRLRYGELENVPLDQWEEGAVKYPLEDAESNLIVHEKQDEYLSLLDDEFRQAYSAFCLQLMSVYGIRTNPKMVARYRKQVQEKLDRHRDLLLSRGFLVWNAKEERYNKKIKLIQQYAIETWKDLGIDDYPKTDTGLPKLDEQTVQKSKDGVLIAFQEYSSSSTQMDRVNELEQGTVFRIHTRFDELMDTGRTSSSKPNIQNRAKAPGDRECFEPAPGSVYMIADFDGLELRTIAQSCIFAVGFSRLAEVLNAGEDPHLMVAAQLLGTTYEDAKKRYQDGDPEVDDARGAGKAKMVNFSCWAGTTVNGLLRHSQEVGYNFTKEYVQRLYDSFLATWPEAQAYFNWIRSLGGQAGIASVVHFQSNRHRGLIPYTVACNTFSQGLGADVTKAALRALTRECYIGKTILFGCRGVDYIHDEYIVEGPDDALAHDRAQKMADVLKAAANEWLPDVPTRAKPYLSRRWSKLAKAVYENGRLVPWDIGHLKAEDREKYFPGWEP